MRRMNGSSHHHPAAGHSGNPLGRRVGGRHGDGPGWKRTWDIRSARPIGPLCAAAAGSDRKRRRLGERNRRQTQIRNSHPFLGSSLSKG
ncbi:hypothetical protein JTE90_001318 [Oedothorax gibbosus]|uniref:Uncharacterized protein n=1 Tax=Oedothorax gibbosus TaxID=931172 RepID=A0AAV6U1E2_9ARAC|nr:hypothetical protein JTE90_001318 [Oedothorax gibbosus]